MSQNDQISTHLKAGKSITARQAIKQYEIYRLSARIDDLKNKGMDIQGEMVTNELTGKRYKVYRLPREQLTMLL